MGQFPCSISRGSARGAGPLAGHHAKNAPLESTGWPAATHRVGDAFPATKLRMFSWPRQHATNRCFTAWPEPVMCFNDDQFNTRKAILNSLREQLELRTFDINF